MTNLIQRVRQSRRDSARSGIGGLEQFAFGGNAYAVAAGSSNTANQERIEGYFEGLVQAAYKRNGVIFACMLARKMVFSEARFQYRQIRNGRPGDLFGTAALGILERPWRNGTTGDLLTRLIDDADLAGNAFVARRKDRLRRMRPDWVTMILGSHADPSIGPDDLDAEVIGYVYGPPKSGQSVILLPDEVAHFAPLPDPVAHYRGMSWLTPVIREIEADHAATGHKLAFFQNGATPQLVVSMDKSITKDQFQAFVSRMDAEHRGWQNAYKTLYLGGGADVTVAGKDLAQLEFKATQGAGETRIAAASGVPPIIVGLSEGLSSATYSNYGQARRRYADGTMRPLWRMAAGALESIVPAPAGAQLWYDDRDIAFLREDRKDAAEIQGRQATTIRQLVDAGYEPASVVDAVQSEDYSRLTHTGLFSVQLQPPGTGQPADTTSPAKE